MAKFTQVHERHWILEPVVGHDMTVQDVVRRRGRISVACENVTGHETQPPSARNLGTGFPRERYDDLRGASEKRTLGGGDYYFVPPGEAHIETAVDECTVLIIKAEPNIQYQIDDAGNRRN
jgi:hypothetical protein